MAFDRCSVDRLMSILASMALAAYLADDPKKQIKKMAKKYRNIDQTFNQIYKHPQRDRVVLKAYWELMGAFGELPQ